MRRSRIGTTALFAAAVAAVPTTLWANGNPADQDRFYTPGALKRPDSASTKMRYFTNGIAPVAAPTEGGVSGTWIGGGGGAIDSFIVFGAPSAPAGTDPQEFELWSPGTNWSGGTFPQGGGDAYIGQDGLSTDGERLDDVIIYQDVDTQLDNLTLDNSRGVDIQPTLTTNPLRNMQTGPNGLRVNTTGAFFPEPIAAGFLAPGYVFFGQTLQTNITGAGSVIVDGGGKTAPVIFAGNNTFSGGLTIRNGGMVTLAEIGATTGDPTGQPFVGDAALGGAGVAMTLDGGTLRAFSNLAVPTQPININRPINVTANGGTFQFGGTTPGVYNGVISGGPTAVLNQSTRGYGGTYTYTAANTLQGTVNINTGTMNLTGGAGAFAQASTVNNFGGSIRLDNAGGTINRLSDSATVRMVGGELILNTGSETVGTLISSAGMVTATYGTSGGGTITANLGRENGGALFIRGTNVGTTATFNAPNAAALSVGGGGAANTTNRSIIPWVWSIKSTSVTANTQTGGGTGTFVGPDASNNLVPLDLTTEYSAALAAGQNVNITANTVSGGAVAVNALRLGSPTNSPTGAAPTLSGSGIITITSGGLLNTVQNAVISAPITAGSNELIVLASSNNVGPPATVLPATVTNGLNIQGVISGTGGLTKIGPGHLHLSGANTYTGVTRMGHGRVFIAQNIPSNQVGDTAPNPFGLDTSAIELMAAAANPSGGGSNSTRLINESGLSLRFGRDIRVTATGGSGAAQIGGFNLASSTEFYGNIEVASREVALSTVGGSLVTVSGRVTGPGGIQDAGSPSQVFRLIPTSPLGNTFSGGTQFNPGAAGTSPTVAPITYEVGGVTPLGTGVVYTSGGVIRAIKDVAGTIATGADPAVTLPNQIVIDPTENTRFQDERQFDGNLNLTGGVDFGGIGPVTFIVPATGNVNFSGTFKNGSYRKAALNAAGTGTLAFSPIAPVAGANTFSSGTMTLSGNNETDTRQFVGTSGFETDATPTFDDPGGLVVLASNNALGRAGIQVESNGSAVGLSGGITTPAGRNVFLRTSQGYLNGVGTGTGTANLTDLTNVVQSGALFSLSGSNTLGGNLNLIESSTVGANAGATLAIGGFIADLTGQGPTATTSGTFSVPASSATLTKVGPGTVSVNRLADTNVFNLTGGGTATLVAPGTSSLATVNVTAGTLRVTQGGANNDSARVSAVRNLQIAGASGARTAQVDLTNQALVVDYTGASPLAALEADVKQGRGTGDWSGNGITSSTAGAGPSGKFAVGVAELTDTSFSGTYLGFPVDTTAVLFRYTLSGDTDLSGTVDIGDFSRLAANFNQPGRWASGDANYSGTVDIGDFSLLAANFNQTAASLPRGAAVPEPTGLALVGLALGGLAARRRRK